MPIPVCPLCNRSIIDAQHSVCLSQRRLVNPTPRMTLLERLQRDIQHCAPKVIRASREAITQMRLEAGAPAEARFDTFCGVPIECDSEAGGWMLELLP